jgi:L-alanine-DL-glutamate epimerase-like enolase superfamily enzyme
MLSQLISLAANGRGRIDRSAIQVLLPAGGARNALDCALWELEARQRNDRVWRLAGIDTPRALLTTCTVGADDPDIMADVARGYHGARAIKIKLTGDDIDIERLRAVREACPNAWLGVDANRGYTPERLPRLLPELRKADVQLLEQPFPIGFDEQMADIETPIAVGADESVQTLEDLPRLVGRCHVINIKLDKCGGLTHGLRMAQAARQLGFRVMVGNMLGTSWAMASAWVIGQLCDIVDLDGPLLLAGDREPSVVYRDGYIDCPDDVWGA